MFAPNAMRNKAGIVPIVKADIAIAASKIVFADALTIKADNTRPHGIKPKSMPSKYLLNGPGLYVSAFDALFIHWNGGLIEMRAAHGNMIAKLGKALMANMIAAVMRSGTVISIL